MPKFKIILVAAIALAGLLASLLIQQAARQNQARNAAVLREQRESLAKLAAEHQRLLNLALQANPSAPDDTTTKDYDAETAELRAAAKLLRQQTNQLGKQLAENRRVWELRMAASSNDHTVTPGSFSVVSDSISKEYAIQLNRIASASPHALPLTNNWTMRDARQLSSALRRYADDHQGEFPSNFDQAAPYLSEGQRSPQASAFEILYQGSLNELANIPAQAVTLIREREAWPTPRGKWARIYVMIDGRVNIVESYDNFRAWEADHTIPPPIGRP